MTPSSRRLVCSVLAVTVLVGFAVSLVGCANLGPVTPVAVSDVTSVQWHVGRHRVPARL